LDQEFPGIGKGKSDIFVGSIGKMEGFESTIIFINSTITWGAT